jgi:hypothetical protein
MAKSPVVKITWLGDATGAQKSAKDVGDAVAGAEVKVEGFGVAFAKFAAQIAAVELARRGGEAMLDYSNKVNAATTSIAALTKSQEAVARAQALANREVAAGRGAYSDTLALLNQLTPVSLRTGQSIESLYQTALLLSTLNSGPGGGVEGAIVAISEALSGDWTSAIERFNLPRSEINKLKAEGVPALEILNRTLAESGVTMDTVNAKSKNAANQWHIFLDTLARTASEAGPVQEVLKDLTEALNIVNTGINTGTLWEEFVVTGEQAFALLLNRYNDLVKVVSGGRINFDEQVKHIFDNVRADTAALAAKKKIADPVIEAIGGPQVTQQAQNAGTAVLASYIAGMSKPTKEAYDGIAKLTQGLFKDAQGKQDTASYAAANVALARALDDVATSGEASGATIIALLDAYGPAADQVLQLVHAHQALANAQAGVITAQSQQQAAQAGVNVAIGLGNALLDEQTAKLDAATRAEEQHAAAHQNTLSALGRESAAIQRAASDRDRAYEDETQALRDRATAQQDAAQAAEAASAASVAAAEKDLSATQDRAAAHRGLLTAALKGETEEYLKQLDVIDEETRAIADKWEAEIGGRRRAKNAADQAVTNLTRQQNRETLDYLTRIDAARRSGNERQARQLEREMAARQQSHTAENAIARARAAVAGDEFDQAAEHLTNEAKAQEEKDDDATRAAKRRVSETQAQAAAQKVADDAAAKAIQAQIDAVGRRQQADQRATQDRQRAIQDETDKENARYAVIQAGDTAAHNALAALINTRKGYWTQEQTQLGVVVVQYDQAAKNAEKIATAAKDTYERFKEISELKFDNLPPSLRDIAQPIQPGSFTQPRVSPGGGGGGGGGGDGALTGLDPGSSGAVVGADIWNAIVRAGTATQRG